MTTESAIRKNIILFTGPNRIFRERDLSAWVRAFERKYSSEQVIRLDVGSTSPESLRTELVASGIFTVTKLVILSGFSAPSEEKSESESAKSSPSDSASALIADCLEHIPDTTFVVVHAPALDRRSKFSKLLEKSVTVKRYDTATEYDIRAYAETYGIAPEAARLLAERYADNMENAAKLLEILSLYRGDEAITLADVREHATVRSVESVFPIVDAVLAADTRGAADAFVSLLGRENCYALLASLISNLRVVILTHALTGDGMDSDAIGASVKVHPFVLKKSLAAKKNLAGVTAVYGCLLEIDRRVKTGRIVGSDESGAELLMEACLRSGGKLFAAAA